MQQLQIGIDLCASSTKYLKDQEGDRMKRSGIGLYERSGLSGYQATSENPKNNTVLIGEQGPGFP